MFGISREQKNWHTRVSNTTIVQILTTLRGAGMQGKVHAKLQRFHDVHLMKPEMGFKYHPWIQSTLRRYHRS